MKNSSRGFTLIELLVVIAIIGVLSSVVLASLNTARSKGSDAAVKANLNGIRAQAELYYDSNSNSYGTTLATTTNASCTGDVFSDSAIVRAIGAASTTGSGTITCAKGSGFWALAASLKTDSSKSWCISSNGNASEINTTSALTAGNSCY